MAVDPDAVDNPALDLALEKTAGIKKEEKVEDPGPIYRVFEDAKIPVSKQLGKLWRARIDQGKAARDDIELCWSEAIRYYCNDQMNHRGNVGSGNQSGNRRYQRTINDQWSETENVVFANATTMLPMLYAKNPSVECTPTNTVNEDFAKCCERLINAILNMNTAPGLNLKSKARRGVLWAILTNNAYTKIDFVSKTDGSENALAELQKLSEQYAAAKTKKEIKEVEGKLMALEEKVSILSPSGPKISLISPFRLVIDPSSTEPDHSDANWIAEFDYLPTEFINATYGMDKEGKIVSVYEPTHVLKVGTGGEGDVEDQISNFSIFTKDPDEAAKNYGYQSDKAFRSAQHTKVWWVWDKTTRRLFLYADNKWEWPLWVWDDPLKLLEFFPYTHLWFHETPEGSQPKGEVTYYLDQQDAINDINSETARARRWAKNNVVYNKNVMSQQDAEEVLKGPDGTAKGVDVPETMKISDCIQSVVPPSISRPELFDPSSKFASINRITGISDAQRGAQFKTNTTNDAIDFYQKNVDIRVDEKIDAIEDWIGMISWKLLQLLAMHWTAEDVAAIVGQEHAKNWKAMSDPSELRTTLNIRIVGGSTDKPTSKVKKKAALEIGQIFGQFANAIPATGIVALKVFERAFADDITITEEDWQMIHQSMQAATQKAGAGPGGAEGGDAPPDEQQLRDIIEKLPPEAKAKMQQLIKGGVSPTEALKQVAQETTPSNQAQ